ncbi:MAG: type II toxin-antitoxin system RelE/ParE family toxin [Planctomycetes bacterium]|nr:type II toxin-antitoxin system RelE/ParE family toxin [Planctomycetota bacterium]
MEYEIAWTDPAALQLEELRDYIAEDNPSAADRVVERILARVERLKWTPRMGIVYRKTGKYPIRKIVSGKYRIFYRIIEDEQRVEILVVWHGARRDPDFENT